MCIIYTCTCAKCKKLNATAKLFRVSDVVVCAKCFNDALLIASPAEYYTLISIKEALQNEPIVIE